MAPGAPPPATGACGVLPSPPALPPAVLVEEVVGEVGVTRVELARHQLREGAGGLALRLGG